MDPYFLFSLLSKIEVQEIYHLAAQSHVAVSFDLPQYSSDVDAFGTTRLLYTIIHLGLQDKVKFYNVGLIVYLNLLLRLTNSTRLVALKSLALSPRSNKMKPLCSTPYHLMLLPRLSVIE